MHLSALGTSSPLTTFSNILPILNDDTSRNYRGSSQTFLLIDLEKYFSRLGMNLFHSWHWGYTLGTQLHYYKIAPASEY